MENLRERKDLPEQIKRAIEELEALKKDPNIQTRKDMFIRDYFQGITDAIREGEIKGKIEIATNLISKGYTVDQIVDITGLSINEIEKLKANS